MQLSPEPARRVLFRCPKTTLKDLLSDVLVQVGDDTAKDTFNNWSLSLCPSPRRLPRDLSHKDLEGTLPDIGIVFGSVLTFTQVDQKRPVSHQVAVQGATAGLPQ